MTHITWRSQVMETVIVHRLSGGTLSFRIFVGSHSGRLCFSSLLLLSQATFRLDAYMRLDQRQGIWSVWLLISTKKRLQEKRHSLTTRQALFVRWYLRLGSHRQKYESKNPSIWTPGAEPSILHLEVWLLLPTLQEKSFHSFASMPAGELSGLHNETLATLN